MNFMFEATMKRPIKKSIFMTVILIALMLSGCTIYTAGTDLSTRIGQGFNAPSAKIRANFDQVIKDWPMVIAFYKQLLGGEYQFVRSVPRDIQDSIKVMDDIAAKGTYTDSDKAAAAGALLYLDYRAVSWLGDKSGASGYLKAWLGSMGVVL